MTCAQAALVSTHRSIDANPDNIGLYRPDLTFLHFESGFGSFDFGRPAKDLLLEILAHAMNRMRTLN